LREKELREKFHTQGQNGQKGKKATKRKLLAGIPFVEGAYIPVERARDIFPLGGSRKMTFQRVLGPGN